MTTDPTMTGVPSFLESPPSGSIAPPVVGLHPVLPCELLTWQNFERLCVRLTQLDSEVEHSQLYGVGGQSQEGIDLYARGFDGSYAVHQCKRIRDIGPADIRKAVDNFLKGTWADRAKRFVLCTSQSVVPKELAEEREKQTQLLKAKGVGFAVWDREEISSRLRGQPRLVFDFFGKAWVEAFLGQHALEGLGGRLETPQVSQFRSKLRMFYSAFFAEQDPGIPIPPRTGVDSISIMDRFVSQDVYVDGASTSGAFADSGQRLDQTVGQEYGRISRITRSPHDGQGDQDEKVKSLPLKPYRTRESLSAWLRRSKNSLITGGPGSGKSTLLRYLALEILTENLVNQRIGAGWSESLPVWLPFAFWTKRIVESGPTSVTECARQWLESWNQGELWGLVQQALEDERLLLLVDGLDEAANEEAGRSAVQQLQVFVQTHAASVITTSRPLFNIGIHGASWQAAELATLSDTQRADISFKWFQIRNRVEGGSEGPLVGPELVQHQTGSFVEELGASPDLEQLSRVPLLLVLLMFLRFRNAILPRDRFQAYEKLVNYLLGDHPAFRRAAASQIRSQAVALQDGDVLSILGKVAFAVQVESPEGQITSEMLRRYVEEFLNDERGLHLNLGTTELRSYVDEFIRRSKDSSGILVAQGANTVGFLHRALQEYLAAFHIASLPMSAISELFTQHGHELRWREVILNVLWQLPRPHEVGELLASFKRKYTNRVQDFYVRELLTEAACTDIKCPADLARELATEAIQEVENHDWLSHRRRLVRHLIAGLNIPRTKEILRRALKRWVFRSGTWRPAWYDALSQWPLQEDIVNVLITCLNDEDFDVQRSSAKALAAVAAGDGPTGDRVADIAKGALDLGHAAAGLRALSIGWPNYAVLPGLLKNAMQSQSRVLRLTGMTASVRLGDRDESLFRGLVEEASGDPLNRAYQWEGEIAESLALGWKGSNELKKLCLGDLGLRPWREGQMNSDIAQQILLSAFPSDSDVAKTLADQIANDRYPFSTAHVDYWKLLAENFRDDPTIVRAVDEWATKAQQGDMELRYAAIVGRTSTMKQILLKNLATTGYPPFWDAEGLLEGWGADDPEASSALRALAYGESKRASAIARSIPDVLKKPDEARQRLMELLSEPEPVFPQFIVSGLSRLADRGNEAEIVEKTLEIVNSRGRRWLESLESELIFGFANDGRVRSLALELCETAYPPVDAIAKSFGNDPQLRSRVLELVVSIPTTLRTDVIDALAKTSSDSDLSLQTLERYDDEYSFHVKTLGSVAYHRTLLRSGNDTTQAFDSLAKAIASYGPDHEARRQAALAGAIILKRLDAMDQRETIGESRPVSVRLDHIGQPNLPLLRVVATYWGELRAKFGDDLSTRLVYEHGSQHILEALALVASEFPRVQDEIWTLGQEILLLPELLKLLASVRPKSETLKERCLAAIRRDDGTWGGMQRVNAAALIAANDFGGDSDMKNRIVGSRPAEKLSEGEIIALGLGWPDDEIVGQIDAAFRARKIHTSVYGQLAVYLARVPASKLTEFLTGQLGHPSITDFNVREAIAGPVERRLKRDTEARNAVQESLRKGTSVDGKATFPRLLARASGLTEELHDWVEHELTKQLAMTVSPEAGFDLVDGTVRSVPLCLLDVLDS